MSDDENKTFTMYQDEGYVEYTYQNGDIYKGYADTDFNGHINREGKGTLFNSQGQMIETGEYKNNKLISGVRTLFVDSQGSYIRYDNENNIIDKFNVQTTTTKTTTDEKKQPKTEEKKRLCYVCECPKQMEMSERVCFCDSCKQDGCKFFQPTPPSQTSKPPKPRVYR